MAFSSSSAPHPSQHSGSGTLLNPKSGLYGPPWNTDLRPSAVHQAWPGLVWPCRPLDLTPALAPCSALYRNHPGLLAVPNSCLGACFSLAPNTILPEICLPLFLPSHMTRYLKGRPSPAILCQQCHPSPSPPEHHPAFTCLCLWCFSASDTLRNVATSCVSPVS